MFMLRSKFPPATLIGQLVSSNEKLLHDAPTSEKYSTQDVLAKREIPFMDDIT
jgi:hypothetical protein